MKTETKNQMKSSLDKITDKFLCWPLPESVCADLCATKQGKGRVGTNLLSFTEAKQMFSEVVGEEIRSADANAQLLALLNEKEKHVQNLAMFVKRLVRQSYKLGKSNKLTKDSMTYINDIVADCSPMRGLMDEVMPKRKPTPQPSSP